MPNPICVVSNGLKVGLAIAYSCIFFYYFFSPEEDFWHFYFFLKLSVPQMYHLKPYTLAFRLVLGTYTWLLTQFQWNIGNKNSIYKQFQNIFPNYLNLTVLDVVTYLAPSSVAALTFTLLSEGGFTYVLPKTISEPDKVWWATKCHLGWWVSEPNDNSVVDINFFFRQKAARFLFCSSSIKEDNNLDT